VEKSHRATRFWVQADGFRNSMGTFKGVMRDGRLVVNVNLHTFSQTCLYLQKGQVERRSHGRQLPE
jgi:hypothetical protein